MSCGVVPAAVLATVLLAVRLHVRPPVMITSEAMKVLWHERLAAGSVELLFC
jgi:hypothetical protein